MNQRVSRLFTGRVSALSSSLVLLTATRLLAQPSLSDSRAAVISADIKKTGGTKVLVCDFSGPRGLTALGIERANEFGASETVFHTW